MVNVIVCCLLVLGILQVFSIFYLFRRNGVWFIIVILVVIILYMGRSFKKFEKPRPRNLPPVDFNELNKHLDGCSFMVSRFMKNVKFLLKRRKSNLNKMITYYKGFGIRISKSYLSELNSGKTKTCNLLILQFLASYLGMSVADLMSHDYTIVDKQEEVVDSVASF